MAIPYRTVHLTQPYSYRLAESLVLDHRHSHTTWKSSSTDTATIHGGYDFTAASFSRCDSLICRQQNDSIWVATIPNEIDLGKLESGGLKDCAHGSAPDLYWFLNDQSSDSTGDIPLIPLTLARYPNINDAKQWFHVQNATAPNAFERDDNDTINLTATKTEKKQHNKTDGLWLHGFWAADWADNYVKVAKIHKNNHQRTVTIDNRSTPILYNVVRNRARYYWLNALELLDVPGEFYIDQHRRLLYIMAPSTTTTKKYQHDHQHHFPQHIIIRMSTITNLVQATNLQDTTFENIDWRASRGTALRFDNATRVSVVGGSVQAIGGDWAVDMRNALECTVQNVKMNTLACGGINIQGGNPRFLTSSQSQIHGCHIENFALWKATYQPAIRFLDSVGLHASHNTIASAPHLGMFIGANDCFFEHNTFTDLCTTTTDCGAFYSGRSLAQRNNTLRHNTFVRINNTKEGLALGFLHAQAVYLDDEMSGYTLIDTAIVDSDIGILVGGGRRNRILNTTAIRVDMPIHMDERGFGHGKNDPLWRILMDGLRAVHYQRPPWSNRHPEVAVLLQDRPGAPVYNAVLNLTFCHRLPSDTKWFFTGGSLTVADLLVWDNEISHIHHEPSLCSEAMATTSVATMA
eukprot:CAMPEP_0168745878 /NCGR_PEP_ID=MMETSP0724-20121128/14847_1 /TAXON_ID=265536 /ORGANISM="Amphiprora sp., Strain CCMP467" /LENGTH=632 /DNA_ID=CAMNT_0008793609 /DNA_START=70 /DNA_END=1968 /DNA_ORIENTATION=+